MIFNQNSQDIERFFIHEIHPLELESEFKWVWPPELNSPNPLLQQGNRIWL
jgi:hypothetical protein